MWDFKAGFDIFARRSHFDAMPIGKRGGSRPGERRGGRKAGTLNKKTIEKAIVAEQVMKRVQMAEVPLGKEILGRFMIMFAAMAQRYQPSTPSSFNPQEDLKEFERWGRLAMEAAKLVAPYQSPTFRAIMTAPAPDDMNRRINRFTISVFEDNKLIDHISNEEDEPEADDEAA